jgi:hypothetical protein
MKLGFGKLPYELMIKRRRNEILNTAQIMSNSMSHRSKITVILVISASILTMVPHIFVQV